MTVVDWLGCDFVTGRIVEELPDLRPSGVIGARLCAYTSATLTLPVPLGGRGTAPRNWEAATTPGRSMIVAVLGDVPVWGGIVLRRAGGTDASVTFGAVSLEGYLDRRYVRDHVFDDVDQALIAASLVDDALIEGPSWTVDAPSTGTLRDRTYIDQDDKTVYSALRELAGVQGGPEWTIDLEWSDTTHTVVQPIVRVRSRIGHPAPVTPSAVFSTGAAAAVASSVGASEASYTLTEDYASGSGANHVVATSSGEGDARPQSSPARDETLLAVGWPRYEHRFTPSTSITSTAVLDGHAAAALAIMGRGASALTISARADAYPVLGADWALGDDIGYELTGHRHPDGLTGVARAIGWDLDPMAGVVSPILLATDGEVIS